MPCEASLSMIASTSVVPVASTSVAPVACSWLVRFARRLSVAAAAAFSLALVGGCGGGTSGQEATSPSGDGGTTGTGDSCDQLGSSARQEVSAVIEANQACTVDTDCVTVSLAASCFDSCSRVVSTSAEAEVTAAKARVNGAQCQQFLANGCKFFAPPCVPPMTPKCTAGRCGGG